jgi:hypothetical protein
MPIVLLPIPVTGYDADFVLVDVFGVAHPLTATTGVQFLVGRQGAYWPPTTFAEDAIPFQPGARLRQVNVHGRDVFFPLIVTGDTVEQFHERLRAVLRWVEPRRGEVRFVSTAPDGVVREIVGRVRDVMISEDAEMRGDRWQKLGLVLRVFDVYWQGTANVEVEYSTVGPAQSFLDAPFLPLRLTSSSVFGDVTVDNIGDVETWPIWTLTGPGSAPVFTNNDSGRSFALDVTLGGVDQVIIDTRPGYKTVKDEAGASLYSALSGELWPLLGGEQSVTLEINGTSIATTVLLSYRPRYLGP